MGVLLANIRKDELNYKFILPNFSNSSIWIEVYDRSHLVYRKLQHINLNGVAWRDDPFRDLKKHIPVEVQQQADLLILKALKMKVFW